MRGRKKNISSRDSSTLMEINSTRVTELTDTSAVVGVDGFFGVGLVMPFVAHFWIARLRICSAMHKINTTQSLFK